MSKGCNIQFERKDFLDEEMKYFNKKARGIALMVYEKPEFLDILKDFLLTFINKINFNREYKKWKNELPEFDLIYGKEDLDEFLKKLYDAYTIVKSGHLDKFRGLIFEYLIEYYYCNIYNNKSKDKFSCGCKVIVDGKDIIYNCEEDEDKSRKTVDIAGYNEKDSKFYELKVGPEGFDEHVINYLNILNNEVCSKKISDNIIVGCMTLKPRKSLEIKLRSNKVDFSRLQLNGIKELKEIFIGQRVS